MMISDFPNCCSAKIITKFDSGANAENIPHFYLTGGNPTVTQLYNKLKRYINDYDREGLLVVITSNEQPRAAKALLKAGFKRTRYFETGKHDSKIRLWHYAAYENSIGGK